MNWLAGAALVAGALSSLVFLRWLVRRETARWRQFREAHGEPQVVARRVAATSPRGRTPALRLWVFRRSTKRWELADDSRRRAARHDRETAGALRERIAQRRGGSR